MQRTAYTKAYRVYVYIGKVRYYANSLDSSTGRVSWRTFEQSYPDHFDYNTAKDIWSRYLDQSPRLQKILIDASEEV